MAQKTPKPAFTRPGLAPGLLGAILMLGGVLIIEGEWFILFRYLIAILALILCIYAYQAKQFWWWLGLVPIAFLWNPVWLVPIDLQTWRYLHLPAAAIMVAAGFVIKVPVPSDPTSRNASSARRR